MKSSRVNRPFKYVAVPLWHSLQRVRPLGSVNRSSGNKAKGLMWSACSSPPRSPQKRHVQSSRSNTALRQFWYSLLMRIVTFSGVMPPFHLGCCSADCSKLRCLSISLESRIVTLADLRRRITDGRDNPTCFPASRALAPPSYKLTNFSTSTLRLFQGTRPFLNSVCGEWRFPRWAILFWVLASTVWLRPFIPEDLPSFAARCLRRNSGSWWYLAAAHLAQGRWKESDRTRRKLPHPATHSFISYTRDTEVLYHAAE